MARGGSPQLTFRQGKLGPDLRARVSTTDDAQTAAQVAQRDLGRYYALLAEGRALLAQRDAAPFAIAWMDDTQAGAVEPPLTPLEHAALEDMRERYQAADTEEVRRAILGEIGVDGATT